MIGSTPSSRSSLIEALTTIWERVLQRSPISVDENFFDLGGSPESARELFVEIAKFLRPERPPVTICYAPTIATLATLLEESVRKPLARLALLKSGVAGSPVFIIHGIGSSALDLVKLARKIETSQPIYGLQFKGVDGLEEPFERIEDASQEFLDALRRLQPHGPYFLIGYSIGGLIALEMACRLSAAGEPVALLAMVDSYPDKRYLSFGQRAIVISRRAYIRAAALFRSSSHAQASSVSREAVGEAGSPDRRDLDQSVAQTAEKVRRFSYRALRSYKPRHFKGKVYFVKAQIVTYFSSNPRTIWDHLTSDFVVDTVPGHHLEMLTTHAKPTARLLSEYLQKAARIGD